MGLFSMGFDPGSLARVTELMGMGVLLDAEIVAALKWSADLVVTTAQTNTWTAFQHPTGATADSIYPWVASPSEVEVFVGVPYGRRLEYGFSGMTDSLGRFFPYWPAEPYLGPALEEDTPLIQARMELAVNNALNRLGGL